MPRQRRTSDIKPDDYPFSIDTEVAFITAKTSSLASVLSSSSKIFERIVDLNRVVGENTIRLAFDILWSAKGCSHVV